MLGAVKAPLGQVVNPTSAWRLIREMGAHFYLGVTVFWFLAFVWLGLGFWVARFQTPILPVVLVEPLRIFVVLLAARTLGLLLYVHGAELGYGLEEFYLVPVLGSARPVAELPVKEPEEPKPEDVQPISLEGIDSGASTPPQQFVSWQPTDAAAGLSLSGDGLPPRRPVARPTVAPKATAAADLMSEEDFLESVGLTSEKKP
jgi:hypothetical protein